MMMPEGVRVQQQTMCEYNISTVNPIAFREAGNLVPHDSDCARNCLTGRQNIESASYIPTFLRNLLSSYMRIDKSYTVIIMDP